jgi:hypothetical protein
MGNVFIGLACDLLLQIEANSKSFQIWICKEKRVSDRRLSLDQLYFAR